MKFSYKSVLDELIQLPTSAFIKSKGPASYCIDIDGEEIDVPHCEYAHIFGKGYIKRRWAEEIMDKKYLASCRFYTINEHESTQIKKDVFISDKFARESNHPSNTIFLTHTPPLSEHGFISEASYHRPQMPAKLWNSLVRKPIEYIAFTYESETLLFRFKEADKANSEEYAGWNYKQVKGDHKLLIIND